MLNPAFDEAFGMNFDPRLWDLTPETKPGPATAGRLRSPGGA
jgi:hypothetical protein